MTRKEKREKAAQELQDIKLEWHARLKADYEKTKDFGKSVKNLEAAIATQINQEPQKKTQYLTALRSLVQNFNDAMAKTKEQLDNEQDQT